MWLCFAGYGQSARSILRFAEQIFPDATIVAVDLPAHGETKLLKPHLYLDDITYLVGKLTRITKTERLNVLAFSMGGALALKSIELCPGQVKRAILLAPDGLKRYPMRWFATSTTLGKFLFQRAMKDPRNLNRIMDLLVFLKLMDLSVVDFFKLQIREEAQRERIYKSWNAFKFLQPDLVEIRKKLFRYKIELRLIFGKHDKVIHPNLAQKLSGSSVKHAKVHFLEHGHDMIKEEVAHKVREFILIED